MLNLKRLYVNLLLIVLVNIVVISKLSAQIVASGSLSSEPAFYDDKEPYDMIFFYKDYISGTLRCDISSGIYYTWIKYNEIKKEWEVFSTGQETTVLEQGGYGIVVSDGRNSDTYYCWLFVPQISHIEAVVQRADCLELRLSANTDETNLVYYNPEDNEPYYVNYNYNWTTSSDVNISQTVQTIILEAPYENTTYTVSVSDKFEKTLTSEELNYEAIAVKAAFRAEILKADIPHEIHDSIVSASAPLEMRFFDESLGTYYNNYNWQLGQRYSTEKNPFEVFTEPRTERIVLKVWNNFFESDDYCESLDSITITVMESLLEFPNVFTPNGDGINDEFRCVYRSLKKYQITIMSRWGRIVYSSNDPSKGWDGNIGGRKAPPGVYYYYAEAEGHNRLENGQFEKHKKKGNIHLIRTK